MAQFLVGIGLYVFAMVLMGLIDIKFDKGEIYENSKEKEE